MGLNELVSLKLFMNSVLRSVGAVGPGLRIWLTGLLMCGGVVALAGCSASNPEPGTSRWDSDVIPHHGTDSQTDKPTDKDSDSDSAQDCDEFDPCEHGDCYSDNGVSRCECDKGWTGEFCEDCAAGWHTEGTKCVLDEKCLETSCAFHEVNGGCSADYGTVVCECAGAWDADNHCATCLPGFHEEDDKCVEDEYCLTYSGPCEHDGLCVEEAGRIVCDCSMAGISNWGGDNWEGEFCEICPPGYYVDGDNCYPNEECSSGICGDAGECIIGESGAIECVCAPGWTHENRSDDATPCTVCANGYEHPDGSSDVCVPSEQCYDNTCGEGVCGEYASGGIYCICPDSSFLDPDQNCGACLDGFHFASGTGCVLDDTSCNSFDPCGEHATCQWTDGVKSCDCDPMYQGTYCTACVEGYQDNDDNGTCAPSCEIMIANGLTCGANGVCADDSGVAVCECTGQWTGTACDICPAGNHLEGGDCVLNEACDVDSCNGHGTCSVPLETGLVVCDCDTGWTDASSGEPCSACDSGYQNTYTPADCLPTCATAVGAGLSCGTHGACALNPSTGEPECACNTGYAGADCSLCQSGFHFEGSVCIANDSSCESTPSYCGAHGTCMYAGGVKSCECDPLYTGDTCADCETGFQDVDGDGTCRPTCATAIADGLDCGTAGSCVVTAQGVALCQCATGYTGADCGSCASGYHLDAGDCVADEVCADATGPCVNGSCSVLGGAIVCDCDSGYVADVDGYCTACDTAAGYYDSGSGVCVPEEVCQTNSCSQNGTCNIVNHLVSCTCDAGYAAPYCSDCDAGYHIEFTTGNCELNFSCSDPGVASADCNGNGSCDDSSGLISCTCDTGYDGTTCGVCASGYHMDGGACVADESCTDPGAASLDCNGNGSCADSTGVVVCACDTGWAGTTCSTCATNYHVSGGNCVLNQTCQSGSCNGNGTCSDAGGVISCSCNPGFTTASYCASCITGWHPSGGACVLNEACSAGSCSGNGICDDSTYEVVCTCDDGFAGDICDACAPGYHDVSGDCDLDESCIASSCSYHGVCSDAGGVVACSCSTGYTGTYCQSCAAGFHINYLTGACVVNQNCTQDGANSSDCNTNGSCNDSTGIVQCTCETGYAGTYCSLCANGYHMNGSVCEADTSCSDSTCANGGTCDAGPPVSCSCVGGWDAATYCATCAAGYHEVLGSCVLDETCDVNSCNGNGTCSVVDGVVTCSCDAGFSGDSCASCAVGYSDCNGDCCGGSEVCYNNACVTPLTCDDLAPGDFTECGSTAFSDNAGGTIDCGDCGANGTCVGNVCNCDDNYGVLTGEHECTYACAGYMPSVDCCNGDWLVYCDAGTLKTFYCGYGSAPYNTCGWSSSNSYFACEDGTPPAQFTATCPDNIVVDTTIPACTEDAYEPNDSDVGAWELYLGDSIWATKCGGNYDIYKVYLDAGETINVTLEFTHSVIDLDLALWYQTMDEVGFTTEVEYVFASSPSVNQEFISFTAGDDYPYWGGPTGPGYYLIEIYEGAGSAGGYVLTVN